MSLNSASGCSASAQPVRSDREFFDICIASELTQWYSHAFLPASKCIFIHRTRTSHPCKRGAVGSSIMATRNEQSINPSAAAATPYLIRVVNEIGLVARALIPYVRKRK